MTLWTLYLVFLQIGAFAFGGGYAVLPLISQYVVHDRGWLTTAGLTDLVSLSQMTPGPIAINAATFIGTKVAGLPGAIVATLGNVTPQFVLMMVLGYFLFTRHQEMPWLGRILNGLKPAIVSLVGIATIDMMRVSLFIGEGGQISALRIGGVIGFAIGFLLYRKKRPGVIGIVLVSAMTGVVLYSMAVVWLLLLDLVTAILEFLA